MDVFSPIFWLVAMIVLLLFEIVTLGLTSVWFAGGALLAFAAALLGLSGLAQVAVFVVGSLVLLFVLRPVASKYLNNSRAKTNVDAVIGKTGIVTVEIDNLRGQGKVELAGMTWTARSESGDGIPEGAQVEVVAIEGVKAIVKQV